MNKGITNSLWPNVGQNLCTIGIAERNQTALVVAFFEAYLHDKNPAIHSQEFLCNKGVAAAIRRRSVIVAYDKKSVAGACRYYRRKNGDVSLYQFAIREDIRGHHLLFKMLKTMGDVCVHSKCPSGIDFNNYYKKTGWQLEKKDEEYFHWILSFKTKINVYCSGLTGLTTD